MLRLLVLALVFVCWLPAQAALFTVDTTDDLFDATPGNGVCDDPFGNCSLRAAITEAFFLAGEDHIELPAGTYNLQGNLNVNTDIRLTGAGADVTIIDGGGLDAVLDVGGAGTTLTLSGVTLTGGNSAGDGGGIQIAPSTSVELLEVVVDGNHMGSPGTHGGGIWCDGATLSIVNSTISNNSMIFTASGGAIYSDGCTVSISNSTISGNGSPNGPAIDGIGGTLTLSNVTVVNNVGASATGLANLSGTIANSIVAGNSAGNCVGGGALVSLGYNLDDDGSCPFGATGDLSNVASALLGPLQNNGGTTETNAVLAGSPAIDAGDAGSCFGRDQRGECRVDGDAVGGVVCDIGAYEHAGSCAGALEPLDLAVTYSVAVQEFGPLCCGLGSLPSTVDFQVKFLGLPMTADVVDLGDVLTATISYGDGTWTENDLTSFHLTLDALGVPSGLTWIMDSITTATTFGLETLNNDFELTLAGTDIPSGNPFQYRYTESMQAVALPVPALSPFNRGALVALLALLSLGALGLARRRTATQSAPASADRA